MIYIEDVKMYSLAFGVAMVVIFFALFIYKWQTKPIPNLYCGDFNNYACQIGKCDYIKTYQDSRVGYCRKKFLGF